MLGLALPPGRHRVELRYLPRAHAGIALWLLGLVLRAALAFYRKPVGHETPVPPNPQ